MPNRHDVASDAASGLRPNNLDLVRIFAATQVMIFHTIYHLQIAVPHWLLPLDAFPGVPIFFTISGYLVSASYERQGHLLTYFRNRFLRIYPALWMCIALTLVCIFALGFRLTHWSDLAWLGLQFDGVLYTPASLRGFGMGSYNGSFWTIPVELQFYVLLPLLYWLLRHSKQSNAAYLALFVLFCGIALVLGHLFPLATGMGMAPGNDPNVEKLVGYSFLPRFYQFLLGVALQRVHAYRSAFIAGKGFLWMIAYFVAATYLPITPLFILVKLLLLGVTAISIGYTLPLLSGRLLHGHDISYGVYLYHGLWINVLLQRSYRYWHGYAWVVFALTYLCAILSWKLVEQPALRLKYFVQQQPAEQPA